MAEVTPGPWHAQLDPSWPQRWCVVSAHNGRIVASHLTEGDAMEIEAMWRGTTELVAVVRESLGPWLR